VAVRKKSATKTRTKATKKNNTDIKDPKLSKIVDQLQKRNSDRGYVLHDDINELLDDDFDLEKLDTIYSELTKLSINFYNSEEVAREKMKLKDKRKDKLKRDAAVRTTIRYDDPIRMYLREMGRVPLLDRQGEIEIAKRIEAGQHLVLETIFATPATFEHLRERIRSLENEELRLDEFLQLEIRNATTPYSIRKEVTRLNRAIKKIETARSELATLGKKVETKSYEAKKKVIDRQIANRVDKIKTELHEMKLHQNTIDLLVFRLRAIDGQVVAIEKDIRTLEGEYGMSVDTMNDALSEIRKRNTRSYKYKNRMYTKEVLHSFKKRVGDCHARITLVEQEYGLEEGPDGASVGGPREAGDA
jgi:RNA polymerase primary sigma factor